VPEQEREIAADTALSVVQVGVTDAARSDSHQRLSRTGVRNCDRFEPDRLALGETDDTLNLIGHAIFIPDPTPDAIRAVRFR